VGYHYLPEPITETDNLILTDLIRTNGTTAVGPKSPELSADTLYSFFFPNGAPNAERYRLAVDGPAGEAVAVIEEGNSYLCGPYTGTIGNIDIECKTINNRGFLLAA
jgi:hypothetical protein